MTAYQQLVEMITTLVEAELGLLQKAIEHAMPEALCQPSLR